MKNHVGAGTASTSTQSWWFFPIILNVERQHPARLQQSRSRSISTIDSKLYVVSVPGQKSGKMATEVVGLPLVLRSFFWRLNHRRDGKHEWWCRIWAGFAPDLSWIWAGFAPGLRLWTVPSTGLRLFGLTWIFVLFTSCWPSPQKFYTFYTFFLGNGDRKYYEMKRVARINFQVIHFFFYKCTLTVMPKLLTKSCLLKTVAKCMESLK